jgi:peptide/nickel transport system substrate-binding protein
MLDSRGVPEAGKTAFWDYGRFSDPTVADLLDKAAAAPDVATAKQYYDQLDAIFMKNIPGIPLMYRPYEFYEYNSSVWTGFPNSANPTAPPMFQGAGIEILYKIKAK